MEAVMVTEGRIVIEHDGVDYIFAVDRELGNWRVEEDFDGITIKASSKNLDGLVSNLQGAMKRKL